MDTFSQHLRLSVWWAKIRSQQFKICQEAQSAQTKIRNITGLKWLLNQTIGHSAWLYLVVLTQCNCLHQHWALFNRKYQKIKQKHTNTKQSSNRISNELKKKENNEVKDLNTKEYIDLIQLKITNQYLFFLQSLYYCMFLASVVCIVCYLWQHQPNHAISSHWWMC